MRCNKNGYSEIGYVMTFLIAGIVLASIISVSNEIMEKNKRMKIEILLEEFANKVAYNIEDVIMIVSMRPNINCSRSIDLNTELHGYNEILPFTIEVTNTTVYANTTIIRKRAGIDNPGNINVYGNIRGEIVIKEGVVGTVTTINIIYQYRSIEVKKI